MTDVLAGSAAPAADVSAPAAPNAVTAPDTPVGQDTATTDPVQPRTYSEEEYQQSLRKNVSERLQKERRRLERTVRAELERDFYKQQVEQRANPAQKDDQPKGKPNPKDFQDWDSYQEAVVDYKLEQREAKRAEESKRSESQQSSQRGMEQMAQQVQKAVAAAAKKYADFNEVIASIPPSDFTEPMTAYIAQRAKDGGELAYHLGNNPDEAARIASLPPVAQIIEMHLLESKLTAPPQPTKAPPPIAPSNGQAKSSKDYKDMSTAEHVDAWRNRKR